MVRPLAPLPTKRLSPVVIRLHDTQFKMAPTPTVYVNKVIQANDASVLGAIIRFNCSLYRSTRSLVCIQFGCSAAIGSSTEPAR